MTQQLPLDLAGPPAYGRADFLPADANAAALAWIDRWPDWPGPAAVLVGPAGSGKTHLLHVWAERAQALIVAGVTLDRPGVADLFDTLGAARRVAVDDAEAVAGRPDAERRLFHLYNWLRERGGSLLLAARNPPARWPLRLPDLASRLRAAPVAEIGAPDDALLGAVLVKLFHDRQVAVGEDVIAYLVRRMERSLSAARLIVARIDRRTLADKRAVSLKLLRDMAADLGLDDS
ncbi:MAG: DNA replication protein [Alphaproteobacteria bacterium]|nr:DNA replication protein [Alphaproteobacteria bacterium]